MQEKSVEIRMAIELEKIVVKNDIHELNAFLKTNGLPKYHAGALGKACIYTINVKKVLNNLQALEIILVSKGVIEILNPEALKSLMPNN